MKEKEWFEAMNEEIEEINNNDTWDVVNFLARKNSMSVKRVYKTK